MSKNTPPAWLERILLCLLHPRDRETISGDLCEEFADRRSKRWGRLKAQLWYARQIVSFVPRSMLLATASRRTLLALCLFTALSGLWLGAMEMRLKHPGYAGREWMAAAIVMQAVLTVTALYAHVTILRTLTLLGAVRLLFLASKAILSLAGNAHFEGYVLLISVGLLIQALLTFYVVPGQHLRSRPYLPARNAGGNLPLFLQSFSNQYWNLLGS